MEKINLNTALEMIAALTARIEALESVKAVVKAEAKEMTENDARRVIFGDLKDVKHKDAAATLGLTYGQIYSARKEFTFKAIHKEAREAVPA